MGEIIQMFAKPLSKERFENDQEAEVISLKQSYCTHSLEIDEQRDDHSCTNCGKTFTSHTALLYVLHKRNVQLSSYNLRNEIHFLTEKRDSIKSEIEFLRKEKRAATKEYKLK